MADATAATLLFLPVSDYPVIKQLHTILIVLNVAFVFPEGSQTILLLPVFLVLPKKLLTQLKVRVLYVELMLDLNAGNVKLLIDVKVNCVFAPA